MKRYPPALVTAMLCAIVAATSARGQNPLNDTGVATCFNDNGSTGQVEPATHPRQDCRIGRDAAAGSSVLYKVGAGSKGFDFTKIANNGALLAATATLGTAPTAWACTYDNVTGLMWEVKTGTATDLRYGGNTYSWYETDNAINGGGSGWPNLGFCSGGISCDTQSFRNAVNTTALCTHQDWRLPTAQELKTLVDYSVAYNSGSATIDLLYFPNINPAPFWTASSMAANPANAAYVYFNGGYTVYNNKSITSGVLLVRRGLQ